MSIKWRLVAGACCGLVAATALAGVVRWRTNDSTSAATASVDDSASRKSLSPNLDTCPMQPTMAMGVIARVAEGASVALPGYQTKPLLTSQPNGTQAAPGSQSLVMVSPSGDLGIAQSALAAAKASSTVAGAGIVYLHSTDPALHSCFYDLADKPAAAALAATAAREVVEEGLVTKDALAAVGMSLVTDDPLDANVVIVTFGVPGKPDVRPALGAPSNIFQTQFINAFVNRTTGDVIAAGYAAW